MAEIKVTSQEENHPELRLNFTVYFHAVDAPTAEGRAKQIRHVIETALADEDNALVDFTYPETRVSWANHYGTPQASHGLAT
jgi:hypothetical protein